MTAGYWELAEETAARLKQGWLHTEDTGYLDQDGYLFLTGRKKDIINVGGLKVNPGDVEEVLLADAAVEDAGVAAIEDFGMVSGESLIAAVVPRGGATIDRPALRKHCMARLESYKVPAEIVVVERIPRNDTGKLLRGELAALIREQLDPTRTPAASG